MSQDSDPYEIQHFTPIRESFPSPSGFGLSATSTLTSQWTPGAGLALPQVSVALGPREDTNEAVVLEQAALGLAWG